MIIDSNMQNQPNFKAKVSERYVNSMRKFINNGPNKLKLNHLLTKKIEEYSTFGYDNYTIFMQQNRGPFGNEYRLLAVKDGDYIENGVLLTKRPFDAYFKIFRRFMTLTKFDFNNIMKSRLKRNN